ncbi:MAG TPA: 16S rRNA (cytosine(1402)-N(4))-methyltransferase RsmH [Acidimicrobiales bacterium]|nr:16S rRNA (cytosine(1402)-N(4))-methyltransferase RsmH [Acidimicrobiales bacterium]
MSQEFRHVPVLLDEVLELFDAVPEGLVLDATVGGGGHAAAILERRPELQLLGIDRDPEAVVAATSRLAPFGARAKVVHARFDELAALVAEAGAPLVGALFDLGVSSFQLDAAHRGFSYRNPGPLDMRMDPSRGHGAAELVNGADEETLVDLFEAHGEERFARRIARAVIAARPLDSTDELAAVVEKAIPAAARRRGHPARRVFQALRVAVNEELDLLAPALEAAIAALVPGGRLVVLAYHSGEDQLVKRTLAGAASGGCVCPPGLDCVCGAVPTIRLLNRGARLSGKAEIERNPRAEAARLRAAERLPAPDPH